MGGVSEACIQAKLYRVLKNLIELGRGRFKALEFTDVVSGLNVDGGYEALVVYGKEDCLVGGISIKADFL